MQPAVRVELMVSVSRGSRSAERARRRQGGQGTGRGKVRGEDRERFLWRVKVFRGRIRYCQKMLSDS